MIMLQKCISLQTVLSEAEHMASSERNYTHKEVRPY